MAHSIRSSTSRGAHVRALHAALCELLSIRALELPRPGGDVALRDHIAALERAYPFLRLTESDVAQAVAEVDDEAIDS